MRRNGLNRAIVLGVPLVAGSVVSISALAQDSNSQVLDKLHIPFRAQNKFLAKLAPMGHQIITRP